MKLSSVCFSESSRKDEVVISCFSETSSRKDEVVISCFSETSSRKDEVVFFQC